MRIIESTTSSWHRAQNGSAPSLVVTCAAAIKAAVMPVSLGSLLALGVGITDGRFLQAAYCPQELYVMA